RRPARGGLAAVHRCRRRPRRADLLQRRLHPSTPLQGMSTKDEPPEPHRAFTEQTKPGGSAGRAWRRLYRIARPRATLANGFALLLAALLGVAIVTQVRQTQSQGLDSLREDELVRILDDVTQTGN